MKLLQTLIDSLELIIIDGSNKTYKIKPYKIQITKYYFEIYMLREIKELKIKECSLNYKNTNIDRIRLNFYKETKNSYVIDFSFME